MTRILLAAMAVIAGLQPARGEHLMWDLNREVTKSDNGFPWSYSPPNNHDWITPLNYVRGTVYYRLEVKSCAGSAQEVTIQICFHQDNLSREECGSGRWFTTFVSGVPVVIEWSESLAGWWKKSGGAIDWTRPRHIDRENLLPRPGNAVRRLVEKERGYQRHRFHEAAKLRLFHA